MDEELIYADGYDDAIIGVGGAFNQRAVVYDIAKVLEVLVAEGATYEDAEEFFGFNISGAYVGEHTPIFVHLSANAN